MCLRMHIQRFVQRLVLTDSNPLSSTIEPVPQPASCEPVNLTTEKHVGSAGREKKMHELYAEFIILFKGRRKKKHFQYVHKIPVLFLSVCRFTGMWMLKRSLGT